MVVSRAASVFALRNTNVFAPAAPVRQCLLQLVGKLNRQKPAQNLTSRQKLVQYYPLFAFGTLSVLALWPQTQDF